MAIDWLGGLKFIPSLLSGGKSLWTSIRRQHHEMDFEVGQYGPLLRVTNTCDDTLIIEHVQAFPSVLALALGDFQPPVRGSRTATPSKRSPSATSTISTVRPRDNAIGAKSP